MSRHKSPTDRDRRRLELLHKFLKGDLQIDCGCGEDEGCSECDLELTEEDIYVFSHSADTLQLSLRLKNVDPESKLAMRYNLDDDFADVVDLIEDELNLSLTASGKASSDDLDTIRRFEEAAMLISQIKGGDMEEIDPELAVPAES